MTNYKKKFQGVIGNYDLLITDDGSPTLYSEAYDENCHATAGARKETHYNFILGCKILDFESTNLNILEIGFGLGYGYEQTINSLNEKEYSNNKSLCFISTEIDPALCEWASRNLKSESTLFPNFNDLKPMTKGELNYLLAEKNGHTFLVLLGDARVTIPLAKNLNIIPKINCIYQDAFSPKKNPILWTVEWFKELLNSADSNCLMTTYCSSIAVRKSMLEAGWGIEDIRGFNNKRSMTRASSDGKTLPVLYGQLTRAKAISLSDSNILKN